MTWTPPLPLEVISASDAAAQLGLARAQGARLAETGMLGVLHRTPSGSLFADNEIVARLAARKPRIKKELPPALVLRVGAPTHETGQHQQERWSGFHISMPDRQVCESALRWWPVRDAERLSAQGTMIVVSVATFPAWVGRITGVSSTAGRVAFDAIPDSSPAARAYLSSRLDFPRGPLVDRVNLD